MTTSIDARRGLLMQLTTELTVENDRLKARLKKALALLGSLECTDCMGTKIDPVTKCACQWCKEVDELRVPPID